ncbi:MAG TPA: DNA-binding protein WhiA [Clostridia bacterium]|nr:DNA-binding protein WhiA [Clostridia bacterium]
MSFSTDIKEELSKIGSLSNKDNVKFEFLGYLTTTNVVVLNSRKIKFSTESEYNINRFSKLLNNLYIDKYEITIQGKIYIITVNLVNNDLLQNINISDEKININFEKILDILEVEENSAKSFVRGAFLGSGTLNNPEKKYHLDISFSNEENLKFVENILLNIGIISKKMKKENGIFSLYFKEGEEISKFLAYIGANTSVIKFEEIRVYRDMRNSVNRSVNCETANLNRIIDASLKQIEDIKYIKSKNKFGELSELQKEIADIRLKNPDASLVELGKMLKNQIGKSGVNYRLKTISKIADELR